MGLSGKDRLLRRWPTLPLLALGCWIAWRLIAFGDTTFVGLHGSSMLFYVVMIALCIPAAAIPHRCRALIGKSSSIVALGILASAGTALQLLAEATFSGSLLVACSAIGTVAASVGITGIALYSLELLGRLDPTEVWIWLAYTELLVVSLYFIISGSSPAIGMVFFTALPALAGLALSLGNQIGSSLQLACEEREHVYTPTRIYVEFFLFVFLLSIASRFARSVADAKITAAALGGLTTPAIARAGIALFIFAAIVYLSKRISFSKICAFSVMFILLISGFATVSLNGDALFALSTVSHSTLECIALAMAACLSFKTQKDPFFIGGLALAALFGGSLLVEGFGALTGGVSLTAFYVSVTLCIINALFFLQERTFDDLLGPANSFYSTEVGEHEEAPSSWRPSETDDGMGNASNPLESVLRARYGLSSRECEVTSKLHHGYTVSRIAEHMNLSVYTVRGYIQSTYAKCGVHSRDELLDIVNQISSNQALNKAGDGF